MLIHDLRESAVNKYTYKYTLNVETIFSYFIFSRVHTCVPI